MSKNKKELGKKGEDWATEYLIKEGYAIITRNYYYGHKELDIIALDNEMLVFVEVKTVKDWRFGPPQGLVTPRKQHNIKQAALHILQEHPEHQERISRFDIIAITTSPERQLEHIINAFQVGN